MPVAPRKPARSATASFNRGFESRRRGEVRLEMQRPDFEHAAVAVQFRVEPAHEAAVVQDGQDVVAVLPLLRGDVDLDGVAKVQEFGGALPLPEEGIEGADERRPRGLREPVDAVQVFGQGVARPPQSLHLDLDDPLLPQVAGDGPPPLRRVEFRSGEVVDEVPLGGDAAARKSDEEPAVVVLRERRGRPVRPVRVDPFRQVIDAAEVTPPRHRDASVVPQQLERALVLLQPPRKRVRLLLAFGRLRLEVDALQRSFRAQPPQHPPLRRRRGRVSAPPRASRPALGRKPSHAPPPEREMGDGKDRGFVPPVLVREAVPVHPAVHVRAVVRAEPAPEGEVVGPVHDVHAVELQRARPLEMVDEGRGDERARPPRPVEPLAVQPQSDGRLPRERRAAPAAQRLSSPAATASDPRCFRNQVRIRSDTSMTNLGSRGPCGVRGYTTISVGTPRRSRAR